MEDTQTPTAMAERSRWEEIEDIYANVFTKEQVDNLPPSLEYASIQGIQSVDDWKAFAAMLSADSAETSPEAIGDIIHRNIYAPAPGHMHPLAAMLGRHIVTAAGGVNKVQNFRTKQTSEVDAELFNVMISMIPGASKRVSFGKKNGDKEARKGGQERQGRPIVSVIYHDEEGRISHRISMACTHENDPYLGLVSSNTVELHDLDPVNGFYFRYTAKVAEEKGRGFEPDKRIKSPMALYPGASLLLSTVQPAWKCHRGLLLMLLAMDCMKRKDLVPFMTKCQNGMLDGRHAYFAQDDMYIDLCEKVDSYKSALHGNEARRSEIRALKREVEKRDARLKQAETQKKCDDASIERRTKEADQLRGQLREALDPQRSAALQSSPSTQRDDDALRAANDEIARLGLMVEQQREVIAQQRSDLVTAQARLTSILTPEADPLDQELPDASTPVPDTFDALEEWIAAELGDGRVLVHPRAIAAAKQSGYHDPALAYRALLLLRDVYWPMKFAKEEGARAKWKAALSDLHLDCSHTGQAAYTSKTSSSYQVQVDRKTFTLDMHLKGNSSFDPKFSFRVYFTSSKDRSQVIVGSMPTHLPNRESN